MTLRIYEAILTPSLSAEQIAMQVKMKLLEALPSIIDARIKPIEKIDSIKIIQVDVLNRGNSGTGDSGSSNATGGGNLAEQAVSAALAYRTQQQILDAVLNEIGMKGGDLQGMVESVSKDIQTEHEI